MKAAGPRAGSGILTIPRWRMSAGTEDGILQRISGKHGAQQVEHVAEVHLFVVTRPRGQKLDVMRVRSY